MTNFPLILLLEINRSKLIFSVIKNNEQNDFNTIYTSEAQSKGIENSRISDYDKVFNIIKENIFKIEKRFNYTFKNVVLILDDFDFTFVNLSGYKKLNGSQMLRENIIYILNTLKSYVVQNETKKNIIHIFNSKYCLDGKEIENLPIGLFGEFYSHELSFILLNKNDYKNLEKILEKCNLKITKTILKSFIEGTCTIERNDNLETFFQIQINKNSSNIFYFENCSLKYEQKFNFGSEIVINDIEKVTSIKRETINRFLKKTSFKKDFGDDDLIEEEFFNSENFRKIKKKLIYEIARMRIKEISEILLTHNVNILNYLNNTKVNFLNFGDKSQCEPFKDLYLSNFALSNKIQTKEIEKIPNEFFNQKTGRIVHFGWNKEAIPVTKQRKSLLARLFDTIFS
tara:strand:- start:6995 stop:8191 length:1197 start_codon:yes stop_codon:yes gene_type:complete